MVLSRAVKSKFYEPGAARAEQVQRLFAAVARRYDRLNDVMTLGLHRYWKRRVVALTGDAGRVLDVCCGTGDIAQRFAGRVVGVDFTAEMLQVARVRSARIPWVQADALRLPFADESFDAVTVGYGLRNLADVSAGLREMHRVLRPGGRLVALDFGKPARAWLRRLFFAHLRFHLPWMGRWSCGDPEAYSYIVDSLEAYPAQRGVCELMVAAGYRECGFEEFFGGTMAINFGRK